MDELTTFELIGDPNNQQPMARYMKNHFTFVGAKAPDRKRQQRALVTVSKRLPVPQLLVGIDQLYHRHEREYQYVAIDVAVANVNRFELTQIKQLSNYVVEKAWWDSVDAWRKLFGEYVALHPNDRVPVFTIFYRHDNFWMRRVSLLLQLTAKDQLDRQLLTQAIEVDLNTDEFFIQKAIGWALRSYSKVNPVWVQQFLTTHQLKRLALREASNYL